VHLEQRAFSRHSRGGVWGSWRTGAVATVAVAGYRRRALADMSAVCLLGPRPMGRLALVAVACACLLGLSAVAPMAALGAAAGLVASLCPGPAAWRERRCRRQLEDCRPAGKFVYVHWLASSGQGAGAHLLRVVAAEAAARGEALVLDASNPRLISYYTHLGFQILATAGPPGDAAATMARLELRGPVHGGEA
jgi:GNAT superfamily N-acetyltransferase